MIVEEAPRPAGPYSHAVVAYSFVLVDCLNCLPQGSAGPEAGEVPGAFADQVRQPLDSMRTILGNVGSNVRASLCRGEVVYREGGFVGAGIKEYFCRGRPGRLTPGHLFAGRYPEGTPGTPRGISGWTLTF